MNKQVTVILVGLIVFAMGCHRGETVKRFTSVVEGKTVDVPALIGGKLVSVLVETGDSVHTGQVVAVVDTTELVLQKQQLNAALQEVEARKAILQTQFERARTDLAYAQTRLKRTENLFQQNTVPQQTLDDVRNQYQRAQSAFQAAKQQLNFVIASAEKIHAQIRLLQKKIRDASITSPLSGIITTKYLEAGEAVPPLAPVVEVTHLDRVWVKIFISEGMLSRIKPGQRATIYIDGTPKTLTGTVAWISPRAEFTPKNILTPETRTSLVYTVKIDVPNPEGLLKIGMPVEVAL